MIMTHSLCYPFFNIIIMFLYHYHHYILVILMTEICAEHVAAYYSSVRLAIRCRYYSVPLRQGWLIVLWCAECVKEIKNNSK